MKIQKSTQFDFQTTKHTITINNLGQNQGIKSFSSEIKVQEQGNSNEVNSVDGIRVLRSKNCESENENCGQEREEEA